METRIAGTVYKMENQITFLHSYVHQMKYPHDSTADFSQASKPPNLEPLPDGMNAAVERKMAEWREKIESVGNTLTESQFAVEALKHEFQTALHSSPSSGGFGLLFWLVMLLVTIGVLGGSVYMYPELILKFF